MVAIKAAQAAQFLKSIEPRIVAVLVYGDDAGLVSERARLAANVLAARTTPPGEVLRIEDMDLDTDPDRLHTELRTVSMFGGARVVRTSASRKVNAAFLKPLLEPGAMTGALVVEAGGMRSDDAMRKLFEAAGSGAALPCYADEARDLDTVVKEMLAEARIQIAPDARQILVSRLGADRALSRAEIEKLVLYAHGKPTITVEDVEAVVGDASEMAIDTILLAVSGGNGKKAVIELDRSVASGESPQGVVIMLLRHFQRLHRLRAGIDQGKSFDEAARGIRPPLLFKTKGTIEAHCRAWDLARLDRSIALISRAMKDSRLGGDLEVTIVERLLLTLAALAGGGRRR